MAQHQGRLRSALDTVDPVWARVRTEAEDVVRREPELATFIYTSVLHTHRWKQPSCSASPSGSTTRISVAR